MPLDSSLSKHTAYFARFRPWSRNKLQIARNVTPVLLVVLSAMLITAILAGCAAPGEPTSRHPIVPRPVGDLSGRQLGDAVVLSFTMPRNSTDDAALEESPTIEIYRAELASLPAISNQPTARPSSSTLPARLVHTIPGAIAKNYEINGRMEFSDPLDPGEIAQKAGEELRYFVRTRISQKRASGDSNTVTLRVYPPPPRVTDVQAKVTETAIIVTWPAPARVTSAGTGTSPGPSPESYAIYRAEVPPGDTGAAVQDASAPVVRASVTLLGRTSETEYRDTKFDFDHRYAYIVRSLARAGPAEVESADSRPLLITAKDVFPPAAPQQVEAIALPATPETPASIELVWAISPEPDLAGYVVYRAASLEQPGERLNVDLLPSPSFRDMTVVPGQRYFYRVRAVDRSGNESLASSPAAAEVPGQQP